MSYHTVSGLGELIRVPIALPDSCHAHGHTLGGRTEDCQVGTHDLLWHGYSLTRVSHSLALPEWETRIMMKLFLRAPNGDMSRIPWSKLTAEEQPLVKKYQANKKTRKGIAPNKLGEIQQEMYWMSINPCGVDLSGSFFKKITKPLTNIALNVATGGLYSIGKAAVGVAKGKPILKELKGALASQGIAGGILTPVVGVDKSLALQSIVAGGALTAAAASTGGITGTALKGTGTLLPKVVAGVTASEPVAQPVSYDGGAGPVPLPQPMPQFAQAGMFGDLSPLTIGLLIGVPLLFSLLTQSKGRR